MLAKRPGNNARKLAALGRELPGSVWLGATIGHVSNIPLLKPLLRVRGARLRFLSCEPLLTDLYALPLDSIDWVINGGESGRNPRLTEADWVRDRCGAAGVAFFHKQWGNWRSNPTPPSQELDTVTAKGGATLDGKLWREFPA